MARAKLTDEVKAARAAEKAARDAKKAADKAKGIKTPRKPRTTEKAPKRKDNYVAFESYQAKRIIKTIQGLEKRTEPFGIDAHKLTGEAQGALVELVNRLAEMPQDFKPARKGGPGRGAAFTIGQRVTLNADAMARVKALFPGVSDDCWFRIATTAKPGDKMIPIVCSGVDGELAPFFVDRAQRKELTPFVEDTVPA
jgi:hypothetical protein